MFISRCFLLNITNLKEIIQEKDHAINKVSVR